MSCYLSEAQIAAGLKRFHSTSPPSNPTFTRRRHRRCRIYESLDLAAFILLDSPFYYPSLQIDFSH